MDHSSPLAAMQPPSVHFGLYFQPGSPKSYPTCGSLSGLSQGSFSFKDMSIKKPPLDYFDAGPVRGSSPAASLAADLSQNFHIDQSPQLVTPRRSLFSSKLLAQGSRYEEAMTTPPLPSSSPAPAVDAMEISPLPQKSRFIITDEASVEASTANGPSVDSPSRPARSPLQEFPLEAHSDLPQERKRSAVLRPCLTKSKAQSFQLAMTRSAHENLALPFELQSGEDGQYTNVASLEDMFGQSPPHERPMHRNHGFVSGVVGSRQRPSLGSRCLSRGNSSPGVRKSSQVLSRPRKQSRRSISMYEHPEEITIGKGPDNAADASLLSAIDTDTSPRLQLPHIISEDQTDSLPRIDKEVLLDVMDGKFSDRFDNIILVDCRFEYEYEGGHINGARNYNDKESLTAELFARPRPRTALILHCEYSIHRAPIMAKYIRHRDRVFNVDQYPQLTYPDLYILEGGYSSFFATHRDLCNPQSYVEMCAKEHEYACERGLGKVKQRSKLGRAQTYAFGQDSPLEDSPTGRCRSPTSNRAKFLESPFGASPLPSRTHGRRMLSY